MLTTESAIEQLFGQVKHIPGSRGSMTTCNSIAAAQLVHMRQSRKPLQAVFLTCSCEVKRVSKCLDSSSERGIYSAPAGLRMLFVSCLVGVGRDNAEAWQPSGPAGARAESTTRTLLLVVDSVDMYAVGASH